MGNKSTFTLITIFLFFCCQVTWAQQVIRGKVTDEQQQPLPGVTVLLKGTPTGTSTDTEGNYTLQAPNGSGTLVFSFIGYITREVPVNNQATINVNLATDAKALGEVVVTALGIKREQRALGYATSTVTAKELTEAGNTNFASALYGKAAGVKITTAPGGATSGVNVQIRGKIGRAHV